MWRRAQELGFDHAWTYDHLVWGGLPDAPWFGTVPTLTAAAMVTSTIRLGTFVTSPNYRHPVTFMRDLLALDDISGGRLVCGIGAGGDIDSAILGGAPLTPVERADLAGAGDRTGGLDHCPGGRRGPREWAEGHPGGFVAARCGLASRHAIRTDDPA